VCYELVNHDAKVREQIGVESETWVELAMTVSWHVPVINHARYVFTPRRSVAYGFRLAVTFCMS
jgi:hypothetical protein